MTTNKNIADMEAMLEHCNQHWKSVGGPGAVMRVVSDNGHYTLLTHMKYKDAMTVAAHRDRSELHPFNPL